jgi:outer membrane protein assembly factor BamB
MLTTLALAGCTASTGADRPAPPSATAEVWSPALGFVAWPALPTPSPSKPTWSLDVTALFQSGSYTVPTLPTAPGRVAGVTPAGALAAYDTATGQPAWSTPLPKPAGAPQTGETPLVSSLQTADLNLIAVDRKLNAATDPIGDDQIDVFDGATGRFLWSRTGNRLSAPTVLDAKRLLFDLTNSGSEHGLDEVDAGTGKVLWHNPDVAACSADLGQVLCDSTGAQAAALVDPDTGATRWTVPYSRTLQGSAFSFSAIVGSQVYLGDGQTSTLTAVDVATGRVRWQQDTGISQIAQVFPLDADHVAVAGLRSGVTGSTEQLVSMTIPAGAPTVLSAGAGADGADTSDGGVDLIRTGGKQYFLVIDPDGTAHTLDLTGAQLATAATACGGGFSSVVGDTVACPSNGTLTVYAIPDLSHRSEIQFDNGGSPTLHVIAGTCLLADGNKLTGLGS